MRNRTLVLLWLLFVSTAGIGQRIRKADRPVLQNLHNHISYLANDKLEGRRAGTKGEKLASDYISKEFEKIGLAPMGDDKTWLQSFEIYDGKKIDPSSYFIINGNDLKYGKEYWPFAFSPDKQLEAAVAIALPERGVPWFFDLKEALEENKDNPHFDLRQHIHEKAEQSAKKGATALLVYNSSDIDDGLQFDKADRMEPTPVPVLFMTKETKSKYFSDESVMVDMKIKTKIGRQTRTGHNIIGYLDNGSANTVVIGAHYDHLGHGEDGNSMDRTGHEIHNGADDNASGTAAVIELARMLKKSKDKNKSNYLFIAFSGEELGLNGSKYFTEHATVPLDRINYMINMDMIGRLNDSSKAITIGGYGTSPAWGTILNSLREAKYFRFHFDSSGTGPSDHTSFYRKDIPVLFFFTGLHHDYHRPTDDAAKINYKGELFIIKLIDDLIEKTNDEGKLAFTKTREQAISSSAKFSVTLGIMPDYTFSGTGIRIDGVSSGRPAEKAGMKAGDVIVQLGSFDTSSMENYMKALSGFKKGQTTQVTFKRGNEVMKADVQF